MLSNVGRDIAQFKPYKSTGVPVDVNKNPLISFSCGIFNSRLHAGLIKKEKKYGQTILYKIILRIQPFPTCHR